MFSGPLRAVWLSVALAGAAPAAFALEIPSGAPLSLAEVQRLAEARAPQLQALQARETAAREMAGSAGQLPDPVVKLGVSNVPVSGEAAWNLGREGMTMRTVGVMQELTRGARREARREQAGREADMARAEAGLSLATIRRESALAWLDVAWMTRMRTLLGEQIGELRLQQQAAEAAFRSGRGLQAGLLGTALALGRVEDQLAGTERELASAQARLARWIGEADARRPASDAEASLAPPATAASAEDLRHPSLLLAERRVALADAGARLAREDRTPDMAVEVMYGKRGAAFNDMVSVNLVMPLPWNRAGRQDRDLAAALARADAARAEQEDAQREYRAEEAAARSEWQLNQRRLARYDTQLVPLATQQVEATLAAYRAGTATLDMTLEARRALIDTRMERLRTALDAARSRVRLDYLAPQAGQPTPAQGDAR